MKIYLHPEKNQWANLLQRPTLDTRQLDERVATILQGVRQSGDAYIRQLTRQFDGVDLPDLEIPPEAILAAIEKVPSELKTAIQVAKANIESFHIRQKQAPEIIETMPGVQCWRKNIPIEKVGFYIPGGTAPLFSTVLMLGVPAQLAGCREIVLCSPPQTDGSIHPAILYAAQLVGVSRIFRVGGAQAIAAMAYGTESIPAVYKILGPGNQYVTAAKQLVSREGIAIDMPAGPSEVLVLADESAPPDFVAADLLAQAEHGTDSQVVLIAYAPDQVHAILQAMEQQLAGLPRADIARQALANSAAIVVENTATALELINLYAPEHLILAVGNAAEIAEQVLNAGSVFLGHYSPESVGDYASGTNHTLPTHGFAKAYSGVSLDTFVKKVTFQRLSPEGLKNLGPTVEILAEAEQLAAHKLAVSIRLQYLNNEQ
ncbi:MAG TPA: histidinol dehydrogenase [Saprospiraceae bacterium]|nr:histidinol dehydrogenase [Saprospiraceae bacterium]HMQ83681.1 histidinol dehydrogenase [Saprospiraceae bacterium]